ncbi:PREDICTED: dimethylaniline monooxygenase [N-oxide-forming] 5-like isoform X2 [Crocodylus porosus]|uniref:dimethylaniline monooxygenase [N-oxide-forming] 5-like isoform X2 n=1 Tax=Crocodylus porosus TaxID=8502 RepID=UPI000940451B|nr:PREDICTED: dimethylaniline monooxygenase [N-oxide-forming] 5-like isoform X2 [Crocodylus porosus]
MKLNPSFTGIALRSLLAIDLWASKRLGVCAREGSAWGSARPLMKVIEVSGHGIPWLLGTAYGLCRSDSSAGREVLLNLLFGPLQDSCLFLPRQLTMAKKRVAIIGGGSSGLCAIKSCLDEGMEPVCFERTNDIGGLWRFEEDPEEGRASIYKSVIINTSKEMMCFSDFPIPDDFPNYMHNLKIMEYFRMYAKHFDLLNYIHFKVFLSTRRGAWILNRVGDEGYPMDIVLSSRLNAVLKEFLTTSMVNKWAEQRLNARFSHSHYGLQPTHRILSQHPTVNDDLPNRIISGRVLVKPNVSEFTETAAIFEDGTKEDNIDVVVFATGYSFSFPFLESCVKVVDNQISLYKFVFPPHLEKPTLAFIGLVQPLGAIMPISELQCRWATRVFKGLNSLPSMSDMIADITQKKEEMTKRYVKSQRHTIQVDFVQYMDEIASLTGVKPNLLSLFLTDPKLAMEVFFGPCTPYQYRLRGPGKWDGARRAILTQKERIIKPMKTRSIEDSISYSSVPFLLKIVCGVVLFAVILAYF